MAGPGTQRTEAVGAGTAQQVDQHRLGAIVERVPERSVGTEHAMTRHTGTGLEVGPRRHLDPLGPEPGAQPGGDRRDELGLARRSGAQTVVDVDGGDRAFGGDGEHEHRQRVRAARDATHE